MQSAYSTAQANWARIHFDKKRASVLTITIIYNWWKSYPPIIIFAAPPRAYSTEGYIYPTPPLGQDMTQGQFLSGV